MKYVLFDLQQCEDIGTGTFKELEDLARGKFPYDKSVIVEEISLVDGIKEWDISAPSCDLGFVIQGVE